MSTPVVVLRPKPTIKAILKVLEEDKFDGFPITNTNHQVIGLIGRHSLMVILKNLDRIISNPATERKGLGQAVNSRYVQINNDTKSDTTLTERTDKSEEEKKSTGGRDSLGANSDDHSVSDGLRQRNVASPQDEDIEEEEHSALSEMVVQDQHLDWSDFNVDFHSSTPCMDDQTKNDIAER